MRSAAISSLKATLSEYIAFVKAGEEILITERGKPIARIIPVDDNSCNTSQRMELAHRGILRLGKGSVSKQILSNLPKIHLPDGTVNRIIDEERGEDM